MEIENVLMVSLILGQVLSEKNIEEIIRFAYKHRLFLMADEVCDLFLSNNNRL